MRLILDTHAFLWFVLNDSRLSAVARDLMVTIDNELLISPASYWEIAIKVSIGKYQVPGLFQEWMDRQLLTNDFRVLPIHTSHAAKVATLPFHHRDPFDRLLIAQSLTENIPIISVDKKFDQYSIQRKW